MTDRELFMLAKEAATGAYAPYSGFEVGAALLAESGRVYTGANVENSSYGVTLCAERAAMAKAVNEGERRFLSIAVATADGRPAWPCGICLQSLSEFGLDLRIIAGADENGIETETLSKLLPKAFHF